MLRNASALAVAAPPCRSPVSKADTRGFPRQMRTLTSVLETAHPRTVAAVQRGHLRLVTGPLTRSRAGPLRVLLAENHSRVRDRLAAVLSGATGFEVALETVDSAAIRGRIRRWHPDVVFLAIQLDSRSDIELLTQLRDDVRGTPIVVLTMQRSTALVQRAVDQGASGVVLKDHADSELVPAARAVAIGKTYVSPTITG